MPICAQIRLKKTNNNKSGMSNKGLRVAILLYFRYDGVSYNHPTEAEIIGHRDISSSSPSVLTLRSRLPVTSSVEQVSGKMTMNIVTILTIAAAGAPRGQVGRLSFTMGLWADRLRFYHIRLLSIPSLW